MTVSIDRAEHAGDRGRHAQVALPQPARARVPHVPAIRLAARRGRAACTCSSCGTLRRAGSPRRSRASPDRRRRARGRSRSGRPPISPRRAETRAGDDPARLRCARSSRPWPPGSGLPSNERRRPRRARAQQRGAALAEQIAVVQLVDRVFEIEAAQQRIRRELRRRAGCRGRRRSRLRRRRAACGRADRNRPTPSGAPDAAECRAERASMARVVPQQMVDH